MVLKIMEIWNYSYLIKELQEKINEINCPEMDNIMTLEIAPYAFCGWM